MGNMARYWFKGRLLYTKQLKDELESFGFIGSDNDRVIMTDTDIDKNTWLVFLFAKESQIAWKQEFMDMCVKCNIPIAFQQEW
jgi:hypothetical protein